MVLTVPRDVLIAFLLDAKRHTYAAQGDEASVTPLLPGSRQLEYQGGHLLYRDIYFGGAYFVGQETVYHELSPIWAMCYAGGLIAPNPTPSEVAQVYEFLREALRQVPTDRPYRGPNTFRKDAYTYVNEVQGDLERFAGLETITYEDHPIYELHYCGGLLR